MLFTRQLKGVVGARLRPFLVTSDEFKYHEPVMRKVFGQSPCVYVQVDNRYAARGILRTKYEQVLGTPEVLDWVMALSEDSNRLNTSFVERTNLRGRMTCSALRRRNPAPARKPEKIEQALGLRA